MISTWRPRSAPLWMVRTGIHALAPIRSKYLWLAPPGAADQGAQLRAWEYEGGALANEPRYTPPLPKVRL